MDRENKNLTKKIILGVLLAGGIIIASTNPKFGQKIIPEIIKLIKYKYKNKKEKNKISSIFYRLKKNNLIDVEFRGKQIFVSLTEEGKKKAGKYQIDNLEIKKDKEWDKKWRVLIFDVKEKDKSKREALRGKIIELGLYQLQRSVWVCPYNFLREIEILRGFFGFNKDEMKVITASEIENDEKIKIFFGL
ncbi:MAG: hypothetical protein COX29_03920 [Candidatus Moranbacteria bacterium CG23_combo_of_CG06-09_8_20_14_all_35_22]|nr:MAG: hypothetical protein COX29_03920 [Candidatus Moranbacteria bacterium CG23_combo_of_CG06-09_8_20_14_all_35_22]